MAYSHTLSIGGTATILISVTTLPCFFRVRDDISKEDPREASMPNVEEQKPIPRLRWTMIMAVMN